MSIFFTLFAMMGVAYLFLYPLGPEIEPYRPYLQYGVLGLLVLAVTSQVAARARGRRFVPAPEEGPQEPSPAIPVSADEAAQAGVVQFVARLQEKGRFVDFVMDDVAPYSNDQIGAAARVVHQGCKEVLQEAFQIGPAHGGEEGEEVSLSGEYDVSAYRLVGRVPEEPPYRGRVLHRGWRTAKVTLPKVTEAARRASAREIIAPAEVEIE